MQRISTRQCTLERSARFDGIGVHSARPVILTIDPAPVNTGFRISRIMEDGQAAGPVEMNFSRVTRTTLCTTVDLGDSISVSTVEHVISALSGLGIDNAHIIVNGPECPIMDGSAAPFVNAIIEQGVQVQSAKRKYIKIVRAVTVRNNDSFAALEPYNGRSLDLEIDFDHKSIGRQRMIFEWTPRRYVEDISHARTFGFLEQAEVLRQAGYALGSSLENSIALTDGGIQNSGPLRYEDEFVRHKLLDAMGDLALGGLPIYGRFRSFKGGHSLNALVLTSLFANKANFEIVSADELPLAFDSLDDLPAGLEVRSYLRSVS